MSWTQKTNAVNDFKPRNCVVYIQYFNLWCVYDGIYIVMSLFGYDCNPIHCLHLF